MDELKFSLSAQEADLMSQALDVYAATLMCAPLGLGLDLLVGVRALRERLHHAADQHVAMLDATDEPHGNVVLFARG
jgi:hypothetical protein